MNNTKFKAGDKVKLVWNADDRSGTPDWYYDI